MTSITTTPLDSAAVARPTAVGRHIRGSSLLLAGRFVAGGMNFGAHVLMVRYLSQADYGALAYALSIVTVGKCLAKCGLNGALPRFLPIYHERKQYDKLFGTILMAFGLVLSIGLAVAFVPYAFKESFTQSWINDPAARSLLLVLIFLTPVEALDHLLLGMFAVFASPGSIFLRKHVLGPGLKLAVVLALVFGKRSVEFLAVGLVGAGILGLALYCVVLYRLLRRRGLFEHLHPRSIIVPWREIFLFSIPLFASDLILILMHTTNVLALEHYGNLSEVASFRAVLRLALMNHLVMASFSILYTPIAARLFARGNRKEINDLYWKTASWIAVFSFPVFAVTFAMARPVTVLLYGARYESSAIVLALLSLGYFSNAALGLNGLTVKIHGKMRYIVSVNVAAAVIHLGIILALVPRYGAVGAAIGTCITMIVHNLFKHLGLRLGTGINLFERRCVRLYLSIVVGAATLWFVEATTSPSVPVGLLLSALVSLVVLRLNRRLLDADQVFPELMRIPLIRHLLGR